MGPWNVSLADFLLVTVFLGGGAAWLTGRATARTWTTWWQLVVYIVLLTAATRFIHFSLFHGTFFLPTADLAEALVLASVDFVILMAAAALGRQVTRARQMGTQYHFLYDRSSPLGWRERDFKTSWKYDTLRMVEGGTAMNTLLRSAIWVLVIAIVAAFWGYFYVKNHVLEAAFGGGGSVFKLAEAATILGVVGFFIGIGLLIGGLVRSSNESQKPQQ